MLASCPASILNHFLTRLGIPFRFGINPSRSSRRQQPPFRLPCIVTASWRHRLAFRIDMTNEVSLSCRVCRKDELIKGDAGSFGDIEQ